MKTLSTVFTLAVALVVYPKLCVADDADAERREGVRERMAERMADLSLSDDQETKIADVRKEFGPKVKEAAKELSTLVKEELDKIREILTTDQKEKIRGLMEERRERRMNGLASRLAHLRDL